MTAHNWCPFCCFSLWKYTTAVHKRRKMYIKFVASYCNMVSSPIPKTYCSVTHFMMQFLSSLLCICHTHNSNYLICIYRPSKLSQYSDWYQSDNKCGLDVGFSLCRHICHSAISSIGTWYSDNSVKVTTGNHVELRLRTYRLCICTTHTSSSPHKSHIQWSH